MAGLSVSEELGRIYRGIILGTRYFAGATEEIHETRARIAGLQDNVLSPYLRNMKQETYPFHRGVRWILLS
jgi:hypothetical protein